jgi:hypothetical protein
MHSIENNKHRIENDKDTLSNLMRKVKGEHDRARDFLAPTHDLQKGTTDDGLPYVVMEASKGVPTQLFDINDVAFSQISSNAGIDVRTAKRLQEQVPTEFDSVVNALWRKTPNVRMLRTHDTVGPSSKSVIGSNGKLRAFLSSKFKTFDNLNLLEATLPQLMESDAQWQVVSGDISERRMYLRLKSNVQTGEGAGVGDIMANGIGLSNSEVGEGSVAVFQIAFTLACLNGMQTQNKTRSSHITSARDSEYWGLLSGEAKDADNKALELKVRDLVQAYASRENFDAVLEAMRLAKLDVIEGEKSEAVQSLGKVLQLTKKETSNVLDGLLNTIGQSGYESGSPVTRATLVNAVTNVANFADIDDVDLWQSRGGQVLNLNRNDWARVAMAA